jgi:hypothetical protein
MNGFKDGIKMSDTFNRIVCELANYFVYFYSRLRYVFDTDAKNFKIKFKINENSDIKENIAIVAIWQKKLCKNIIKLLEVLKESNISLIVVNNKKLDFEDKRLLEDLCMVYYERKQGLGRDIAAYKTGIEILNSMDGLAFKKVMFVNDSVLIVPESFKIYIRNVIALNYPWIAATESNEYIYHTSSWFYIVNWESYKNKLFQKYWKKYKGYQSRRYSIKYGEIGISRALRRSGLAPFVTHDAIGFLDRLNINGVKYEEIKPYFNIKLKKAEQKNLVNFREEIIGHNETAKLQLLLLRYENFPFIKKETVSRGVYSLQEVRAELNRLKLASKLNDDDYNCILGVLTQKKQYLELNPIDKILVSSGNL